MHNRDEMRGMACPNPTTSPEIADLPSLTHYIHRYMYLYIHTYTHTCIHTYRDAVQAMTSHDPTTSPETVGLPSLAFEKAQAAANTKK